MELAARATAQDTETVAEIKLILAEIDALLGAALHKIPPHNRTRIGRAIAAEWTTVERSVAKFRRYLRPHINSGRASDR
jgi:hypothetical protein